MKYRQWFLLALSPLLLVVALVGVRSFGGPDVASAQTPQLAIDMDSTGGWCNTIQDTAPHAQADPPYQVAICLLGSNYHVKDFNIVVNYDSQLNSCSSTGQTGTGLNANPDFISTVGTGWDCSGGGVGYPKCGETAGEAYISCGTTTDPGTVTGNWAIAVVTFSVIAGGTDNLAFGTAALYDWDGENVMRCPGVDCLGATDEKTGGAVQPTATQTAVPTATPTATPCPNGICPTSTPTPKAWTKTPTPAPTGTPAAPTEPAPPPPPPPPPSGGQLPGVVPPATGTGSGGVDWTTSLMWTLAGAGALSVLVGGLYLRRARNR